MSRNKVSGISVKRTEYDEMRGASSARQKRACPLSTTAIDTVYCIDLLDGADFGFGCDQQILDFFVSDFFRFVG